MRQSKVPGKVAEAEAIQREVLGVMRRVLGAEHPQTLQTTANWAQSLSMQDKCDEAEQIQRKLYKVYARLFGEEHPATLTAANNLAGSLQGMPLQAKTLAGKPSIIAEAERIQRKTLAAQRRVLGVDHPETLMGASNLASTLFYYPDKHVEAEQILHATLTSCRRVLGRFHPITRNTADLLEVVRAALRRPPPCMGYQFTPRYPRTRFCAGPRWTT
jgi:hypothetical protein